MLKRMLMQSSHARTSRSLLLSLYNFFVLEHFSREQRENAFSAFVAILLFLSVTPYAWLCVFHGVSVDYDV